MHHRTIARLARGILAMALVTAACNDGDGAGALPPGFDPCELLEDSELREILGADVGEGVGGVPADALMDGSPAVDCRWSTPETARTLTLVLRRAFSVEDADAGIMSVRGSFESGGFTPVPVDGLADDAFFAFNQLHVRSGVNYLTVSLTGLGNAEALSTAREAAALAVQRIGNVDRS